MYTTSTRDNFENITWCRILRVFVQLRRLDKLLHRFRRENVCQRPYYIDTSSLKNIFHKNSFRFEVSPKKTVNTYYYSAIMLHHNFFDLHICLGNRVG